MKEGRKAEEETLEGRGGNIGKAMH